MDQHMVPACEHDWKHIKGAQSRRHQGVVDSGEKLRQNLECLILIYGTPDCLLSHFLLIRFSSFSPAIAWFRVPAWSSSMTKANRKLSFNFHFQLTSYPVWDYFGLLSASL